MMVGEVFAVRKPRKVVWRGSGTPAAIYWEGEWAAVATLRHCSSDPGGWTLFLIAEAVYCGNKVDKEGTH